jgi:flagellar motility protein MotE (MotC chaperone)
MKRIRLLPIVIVAASGLFILKATDLWVSGTNPFASAPHKPILTADDLPSFGRALSKHRFTPPNDPEHTGSVPKAKKPPAEEMAKADTDKPDPEIQRLAELRAKQNQPPPVAPSAGERAVLERLQERRGTLEGRSQELDTREGLLKAAERKIDDRLGELKEIESRMDAGTRTRKEEADRQMKMLVTMYETMKPKEAARVFDRLALGVLVPIATTMKPQRMSEILAAMSPEAAEKLTVALASKSAEAAGMQGASGNAPPGELPRIDRPPAALPALSPAVPAQPLPRR